MDESEKNEKKKFKFGVEIPNLDIKEVDKS